MGKRSDTSHLEQIRRRGRGGRQLHRWLAPGWLLAWLLALLLPAATHLLAPAQAAAAAADAGPPFLAMEVTGEIDPGLAAMVERAVAQAEAGTPGVKALVLVVDTPGGLVDAAVRIKKTLLEARVPTLAYVESGQGATSAGALIALSAEHLYMAPGSHIGDAEPIPYSDKAVSYVRGQFESAAQARERDPQVAAAMVDKNVQIPDVTTGRPLSLRWTQAVELGMADGEAETLQEALAAAGLGQGTIQWYEPTVAEQASRFLTQSWVASILLLVGLGAIALEFLTPGFGVPAGVGAVALGLFFGSHMLVGSADWLAIGLVLLGLVLIAVEAFVPGFGIFGLGGLIALGVGVFMTAPDPRTGAVYLGITVLGLLALTVAFARYLGKKGFIRWLTLERRLDKEGGYVPHRSAQSELIGARGTVLTPLRPAGSARLGGRRVDVVSDGDYVPAGVEVEVVAVEGTRVLVQPVPPQFGGEAGSPGGAPQSQ